MAYHEQEIIRNREGKVRAAGRKAVERLISALRVDNTRYLNSGNAYALSEWLREKMNKAAAEAFNRQELNKMIAQALYDLGDVLLLEPSKLREPIITELGHDKNSTIDLINDEVHDAAGYSLLEGSDKEAFRQDLQEELDELDSSNNLDVSRLPRERYLSDAAKFEKRHSLG